MDVLGNPAKYETDCPQDVLQEIQNECFRYLVKLVYPHFKTSERYSRVAHDRVKMYNR